MVSIFIHFLNAIWQLDPLVSCNMTDALENNHKWLNSNNIPTANKKTVVRGTCFYWKINELFYRRYGKRLAKTKKQMFDKKIKMVWDKSKTQIKFVQTILKAECVSNLFRHFNFTTKLSTSVSELCLISLTVDVFKSIYIFIAFQNLSISVLRCAKATHRVW